LIDGHAPLLLLDLHNNKLMGQLEGAVGGGSAGRRLLQQAAGAAGGGRAWSFDTLALLDLSNNDFSGAGAARGWCRSEAAWRAMVSGLAWLLALRLHSARHAGTAGRFQQ
jgi:hypothetical protein